MANTETETESAEIDPETLTRIRERTLEAEKKQLHKRRPHNILPELEQIIKEEVHE